VRHGQGRGRRIEADHRHPAVGEHQREGAGATSDIEHAVRAELLCDPGVHRQIGAVRIESVVDAGEARMLEDRVRCHVSPGARRR
jgi:hypothetical protein